MRKQFFKVGDRVRLKTRQELIDSGWIARTPLSTGWVHKDSVYPIPRLMFDLPNYKWYTINAACQGQEMTGYIFDEKDARGFIFTSEMLVGDHESELDKIIREIKTEVYGR